MRAVGLVTLLGLLATGCYQEYGPGPVGPQPAPEPVTVSGPPGGGMDPGTGYEQPQNPYMPGYPDGYPAGSEYGAVDTAQPSGDPQDPNYVMGTVNDQEIDSTLAPYGEWVEDPEYGRVWRPYATVVGVNFTPYETCGTWVYTEYGWTYSCDWDWGWLPFHYGAWDWFGDYGWCWVPDYTWGPGWVDWRSGGGYVGWRPSHPRGHRGSIIRDHRTGGHAIVRDHRRGARKSDWRFVRASELGRHNIHAYASRTNIAEGLRVTSTVARPPMMHTGRPAVSAAHVMRGRLQTRVSSRLHPSRSYGPARSYPSRTYQRPQRTYQRPSSRAYPSPYRPAPSRTYQRPSRSYQPYQPSRTSPSRTYQRPQGTYQRPQRTYQQPSRTYQRPQRTYQQPSRTYQRPQRTYQRPQRTYQPSRTYQRPSRTYQRPSSSYSRPSRSSNSRPSHSYSPRPSHSSSSRSSSSHSSSSRSHSSSHSSGGHRRR